MIRKGCQPKYFVKIIPKCQTFFEVHIDIYSPTAIILEVESWYKEWESLVLQNALSEKKTDLVQFTKMKYTITSGSH